MLFPLLLKKADQSWERKEQRVRQKKKLVKLFWKRVVWGTGKRHCLCVSGGEETVVVTLLPFQCERVEI